MQHASQAAPLLLLQRTVTANRDRSMHRDHFHLPLEVVWEPRQNVCSVHMLTHTRRPVKVSVNPAFAGVSHRPLLAGRGGGINAPSR